MSELALLLIGAGIALVSGVIGAWVQHFLSLRADRIKRERDEAEGTRKILLEGARDKALHDAIEIITPSSTAGGVGPPQWLLKFIDEYREDLSQEEVEELLKRFSELVAEARDERQGEPPE